MKIKNFELVKIVNTLNKYATYKLPQKINFAITKNSITLEPSAEVYTKALNNILRVYEPYAKKDENGLPIRLSTNLYDIDQDHKEEYEAELNELFQQEVEVELCHVDFSVFDYEDGDKYDALSPSEIVELKEVICDL